jgi:hypothetical protein
MKFITSASDAMLKEPRVRQCVRTATLKYMAPNDSARPKEAMKNVLILGIGNILQRDDGLGVHVVNEILSMDSALPDCVEVIDGGTAGFDLIPL